MRFLCRKKNQQQHKWPSSPNGLFNLVRPHHPEKFKAAIAKVVSMDFRIIENYSSHLVAGEEVEITEYPKWAVFHLHKQISPRYPTRLEAESWLEQKNIGLSKESTEYGFYVALVDEDCIAESRKQRIRDICEKEKFAISAMGMNK